MISIIIPVYNGEKTLKQCLSLVYSSYYKNFEVIVVDDGSTDNSVEIAKQFPCNLLKQKHKGDAIARNKGANLAKGNILLFIDSDIIIKKNTLSEINKIFKQNPEISAVVGSYTKETINKNFFSVYKNLLHYYTHQNESENFPSFWTGCGAVKKYMFRKLKGFSNKFSTIGDIHFGIRLIKENYKILLDKNLQVTHMKKYTFSSLLRSDIFQRAIPWTKMMLKERFFKSDLNLKSNNILSVLTAYLILIGLFLMPYLHYYTSLLLIILFFLLNIHFYKFLYKEKGAIFAAKSIAFNWFSYLCQGIGLGIGILGFLKDKIFNRL